MNIEIDSQNSDGIKDIFNKPARPIVAVDVEKYKVFLDDPSLSEVQKQEFLQALWSIVVTFVELGFGVHPLQEVCPQQDEADGTGSNSKDKRDGGQSGSPELE